MRRAVRLILLLALAASGVTTVAFGYLTATSTPGATAPTTGARTLGGTTAPTLQQTGDDVTVSIQQTSPGAGPTLLAALTGGGYIVRRYPHTSTPDTDGSTDQDGVVVSCAGSAPAGSANPWPCLNENVPAGTWKYTATPKLNNFRGPESATSAQVTVTAGDTVAPAPTITADTTGNLSSGAGTLDEGIAYYGAATPKLRGTAGTLATDSATLTFRHRLASQPTGWSAPATVTRAANGTWSRTLAGIAAGDYVAEISQSDDSGNTGTATLPFTVYSATPALAPVRALGVNGTGVAGKLDVGDAITFEWNRVMRRSTIVPGWADSTTAATTRAMQVRFEQSKIVLLAADGTELSSRLKEIIVPAGAHVTSNVVFNATASRVGKVVRVTLTSIQSGSAASLVASGSREWKWAHGDQMLDVLGNSHSSGDKFATAVHF